MPEDRRWAYPVRKVIETIADNDSFLELRAHLWAQHNHWLYAPGRAACGS